MKNTFCTILSLVLISVCAPAFGSDKAPELAYLTGKWKSNCVLDEFMPMIAHVQIDTEKTAMSLVSGFFMFAVSVQKRPQALRGQIPNLPDVVGPFHRRGCPRGGA